MIKFETTLYKWGINLEWNRSENYAFDYDSYDKQVGYRYQYNYLSLRIVKFGFNNLGPGNHYAYYLKNLKYLLNWNWIYTSWKYDGCPHKTLRLGCFQIKWGEDYNDEILEHVEMDNYGWEYYLYTLSKDGDYQI